MKAVMRLNTSLRVTKRLNMVIPPFSKYMGTAAFSDGCRYSMLLTYASRERFVNTFFHLYAVFNCVFGGNDLK